MPKLIEPEPTFNLWTEAWIALENPEGNIERHGLEATLLRAHEYKSIYESSPLAVVGIHRLLVAVLQAALNPQRSTDLKRIWQAGQFSAKAIKDFGKTYAKRFDLFSADAPFLQSADLPLYPGKDDKIKTVAYLSTEIPAGTAVTHYRHGAEDTHVFCPACGAIGLVMMPAFAAAGGAGIKPSINGVPPIYILPGGQSLFESLAASLLRPDYQPQMASKKKDEAWWARKPRVEKGKEVREVGYLHSLTFPARRVRLHPEQLNKACTRCGTVSEWGVRTMVFEMGESRPKEAAFWFDPFAAYKLPDGKSNGKPTPIRPVLGRATWREFAGLFLQDSTATKNRTVRPAILDQITDLDLNKDRQTFSFRSIGLRTDMKAKVFEWIDAGFEVPPAMLRDENAGLVVREAIEFASECAYVISSVFRDVFSGSSKKSERHKGLRVRMGDDYWAALAGPFRQFVLEAAALDRREVARRQWLDTAIQEAKAAFDQAADAVGDDAETLRQRTKGERWRNIRLAKLKERLLPTEEEMSNE